MKGQEGTTQEPRIGADAKDRELQVAEQREDSDATAEA